MTGFKFPSVARFGLRGPRKTVVVVINVAVVVVVVVVLVDVVAS